MNTSDTEWREVQGKVGYTLNIGENHTYIENRLTPDEMKGIKNLIEYSLTSRDTYWKEKVRKEVEGMPAFTCCSDKCMGQVSDEAKKPAYGTNYLQREALLQALDNLK